MKKLKKATGTKLLLPDDIDEFGRLSGGSGVQASTEAMKRRRNSTGNADEETGRNDLIKIEITNNDQEDQKEERTDLISGLQEGITTHKQSSDTQAQSQLNL